MCDLNICRICLITDVRGYKMVEHNLRNYYEFIMRQRITHKDDLPQWLCYECAMMLHKFHKFKEKCFRGQVTLKQISWKGDITHEAVSIINRFNEKLTSPISLTMRNERVKSHVYKHKHRSKSKLAELERVMLSFDSDDSMKNEPSIHKIKLSLEKSKIEKAEQENDVPVENIEIKSEELPLPLLKAEDHLPKEDIDMNNIIENLNTFDDIVNSNTITNDMTIPNNIALPNNDITDTNHIDSNNDDMGTDHIDSELSSDDENIFLDIVKKAHKGENKLVFLDGIEMEKEPVIERKVKRRKKYTEPLSQKGKVHKFAKPKKEYLSPQYWRKFNLNEEDAMHEFKQREYSDKYVNANYKCHNCLKGFSKVDMLMRHVKLRHDETIGPIECRFCHMRFRQKNQLCKHIKEHYAVYQCLRCDMRFRLETSAIFHEDYHNGVLRKCKHCGEEFKHSSTYYTHLRMAHRSAHLCTSCGASFVSATGLRQHRRIKHFDNSDEASNVGEQTANTYCEKCDVKFASQAAYDEHLTHSDMHGDLAAESEPLRKGMKGNRRAKVPELKEHRKKKPTTCIHCGKHFTTQSQCMKHHYAEHPRRPFYPPDQRHICEVCGASLAAVSIQSHMNRHTREHVYPCAICGMQFISKSSHHRHQVTHTGERPYPCPLCEKRFTQKNSMQLHYRTFHLKQPYPKRNRRKKTDEMPIMECPIIRDRSEADSNDAPPTRWRPAL